MFLLSFILSVSSFDVQVQVVLAFQQSLLCNLKKNSLKKCRVACYAERRE